MNGKPPEREMRVLGKAGIVKEEAGNIVSVQWLGYETWYEESPPPPQFQKWCTVALIVQQEG